MSLVKSECRKFSPNIFNKSKCQNCFACKDSHSAEALDSNRVSRKVSKCGYLFVAPDWDFSNPINRTKRWQRRWFVLFDDGELTYSVDEHPDTIPQALIDMTKVIEVSNAEELTGNQFAIAIIAPEKVHFVKGTSREESKWWFDVLAIFPRSIKNSRHKRNSTFPGGRATSHVDRPIQIESLDTSRNEIENNKSLLSDGNIVSVNNRKNNQSLSQSAPSPSTSLINQTRSRRVIKRGSPNPRSLSDGVNLMIPKDKDLTSKIDAFIVTLTDSNKKEEVKANVDYNNTNKVSPDGATPDGTSRLSTVPRLIDAKEKLGIAHPLSEDKVDGNCTSPVQVLNIRGDPDGCGLDARNTASPTSQPTECVGNIKKGWLLLLNGNDQWSKVWSVLTDVAFEYYNSSADEATGSTTGIIHLNQICSIRKYLLAGQNSFQLELKNGDMHVLSAITPLIRASWLCALRAAVGFPCDDSTGEPLTSLGEKIEKEISSLTDATSDSRPESRRLSLDFPSSPRSGLSSDDEFKTASEASGRTEDYFEWADEDMDQSTSRALPPSPPLNRTPISRVKERARTRSTVRGGSLNENGSKGVQKEDGAKDDLSGSDREGYSTPKMERRTGSYRRRKDSNGTKSDIPESMMVELLESEVDSLKTQLERCQQEIADLHRNNSKKEETSSWQQKNNNNKRRQENEESQDSQPWQKKHAELVERTSSFTEREQHLLNSCHRTEEKYRVGKNKWENEKKILEDECNRLVSDQQKIIDSLEERLRRSETKMMALVAEIEELEATVRKERKDKQTESESIDGNDKVEDLQKKLKNTLVQVKILKKEVEQAESDSDKHELECVKLRQLIETTLEEHKSEMNLMTERVDDLTTKLNTAEKSNRQLKLKLNRCDNGKKPRSLKGKELDEEVKDEEGASNSVQLLVRINALESNVEKATEKLIELKKGKVEEQTVVDKFLSAFMKNVSFFKEKETTLAQLGLLNKQTQMKISLEKMISQAMLIGCVGGVVRSDDIGRFKRRLSVQTAVFEKKLRQMLPKEVGNKENLQLEELGKLYRSTQIEVLATAMVKKEKDVLTHKLTELEAKRIVTSVAHLRMKEESLIGEVWILGDENRVQGRVQEITDQVVVELLSCFHSLIDDVSLKTVESSKNDLHAKLAEFADVVAQEAILLARLEECRDFEVVDPLMDQVFEKELDLVGGQVEKLVGSAFKAPPRSRTSEPFELGGRKWSVQEILKGVSEGKPSLFLNSIEGKTRRSFRQRGQRSVTMPICCPVAAQQLPPPSPVPVKSCVECERLEKKLRVVEEGRKGREDERDEKIKNLERQLRLTEQKLVAKEEETKQQIAALKEAYKQDETRKNEVNEENVRQTYQTEIDQLRGLCEKGLVAMENSHRRIVAELEEKYQRELKQLQVEKEQALAEETQATLAALDAMRKAHETELQREIAKFKHEFLEKMHTSYELESLQKEQEEEIENIKEEILSLSEKYSIKCLENASLEERLKPLLQQLTDANSLAFDLTARNKQLRAMLNLNNADIRQQVENENCDQIIQTCQLKIKESEVMEKNEEIADMKRMLRETRRHEEELSNRCNQLDQSLKAERRLRQDEVSSLRDRLEHIILTSNASLEAAVASSKSQVEPVSEPKTRRFMFGFKGRELMRSPSCPGLSNDTFSAAIECGGVVTSRKHLFEPGRSYC